MHIKGPENSVTQSSRYLGCNFWSTNSPEMPVLPVTQAARIPLNRSSQSKRFMILALDTGIWPLEHPVWTGSLRAVWKDRILHTLSKDVAFVFIASHETCASLCNIAEYTSSETTVPHWWKSLKIFENPWTLEFLGKSVKFRWKFIWIYRTIRTFQIEKIRLFSELKNPALSENIFFKAFLLKFLKIFENCEFFLKISNFSENFLFSKPIS